MDEWFQKAPITTIVVILSLVIVGGVIMYVFARLLIRSLNESASYEQPMTTLMLILGTVTIVSLIGALFTRDESAFTIAATGVGAFAGALTARSQALAEHETRTEAQLGPGYWGSAQRKRTQEAPQEAPEAPQEPRNVESGDEDA